MSSRTKASLLGLSLRPIGRSGLCRRTKALELDAISVISDYESPTGPVKGYRAIRSSSATKTDTAIRDIPQAISVVPASVLKDLGSTSVERALDFAGGVSKQNNFGGLTLYEYSVRGFTTSEFYKDGFSANRGYPSTPDVGQHRAHRSAQGPGRQPVWPRRSRRHGEHRHQETAARSVHHPANQRRQSGPLSHRTGRQHAAG
jgi:iron complex outermembrane receptor protein